LPEKIYTTYQIGKFCQVNIRTVIRWIETGKLKAYSTPGGHRRVKWSDLIAFLTQNKMPIPRELEEAKKKKILTINTDQEFIEMAAKALEKVPDAELKPASSDFEAGLLIAEWIPDLVLLDFGVPEINGFAVTKTIREHQRFKKIPIIAVTRTKDQEELAKIKNSGVNSVIEKPIENDNFLKKIDRILYSSSPS